MRRDSIWDSLVFKRVQQTLGGRCRFICTGSAPISDRVLNFIRVASGAIVSEKLCITNITNEKLVYVI